MADNITPLKNGDKVYIVRERHPRYGEPGVVTHQMDEWGLRMRSGMTRIVFMDGDHVWMYRGGFSRTKPSQVAYIYPEGKP